MKKLQCATCGTSLSVMDLACRACGKSVLVDVGPAAPVSDPRLRYQIARRLVEMEVPKSMGQLLAALERGEPILKSLTRESAAPFRTVFDPDSYPATRPPPATVSVRPLVSPSGPPASAGSPRAATTANSSPDDWLIPIAPASAAANPGSALPAQPALAPAVPPIALPQSAAHLLRITKPYVLLALGLCLAMFGLHALKRAPPPGSAASSAVPAGTPNLTPQQIAASATPSVVVLRCERKLGTGFYVAPNTLITNAHVVCKQSEPLELELSDGRKGEAVPLRVDETLDAAVLRTELVGTPLTLGSAGQLAAGDTIMVIGNPYGMESSFHVGTVSNARRAYLGLCYLQLQASINPGNSGGPAFDTLGRVVGLVSLGREGTEGLAMALPTDYLFEGDAPLLPPPSWHPSAGFRAMLSGAGEATKKLVAEADEVGVRLVSVQPAGPARVLALVSTMSQFDPPETLPFQLENDAGNTCALQGKAIWKKSDPTQGIAKRTKDFLGKQGLGDIYGGVAPLDLGACNIDQPTKLRLLLGKQSDNFVAFGQ